MRLNNLSPNCPATVDSIDWAAMTESDGARLRELGLNEGASIELLHRAGWTRRGAHACRVGRMLVAMRASHAAAIIVRTDAVSEEAADDS